MCNYSDGVIKDQQISNLSIENVDWAPIIASWIKRKKMPMCIYSTGNNNGSERAGIYAEITAIFKANTNGGNTLMEGNGYAVPSHALPRCPCHLGCVCRMLLHSAQTGTCFSGRLGHFRKVTILRRNGIWAWLSSSSAVFTTARSAPCSSMLFSTDQQHHQRACQKCRTAAPTPGWVRICIFMRCPGDVWA